MGSLKIIGWVLITRESSIANLGYYHLESSSVKLHYN